MNTVKAIQVQHYDDLNSPGHFQLNRNKDGDFSGMIICCPGCGSQSWLPFKNRGPSAIHTWEWDENEERPTPTPSVHHTTSLGGCGWHGWLRNGEWVSC